MNKIIFFLIFLLVNNVCGSTSTVTYVGDEILCFNGLDGTLYCLNENESIQMCNTIDHYIVLQNSEYNKTGIALVNDLKNVFDINFKYALIFLGCFLVIIVLIFTVTVFIPRYR